MRQILERISRKIILKRRLPKTFHSHPLYVSPDVALKFWSFNAMKFDSALFELCKNLVKPGDVIWDIGASVGLFSLPAAILAGPSGSVLAVEPDTFCSGLLRRSSAAGKIPKAPIHILSAAISDQLGVAKFFIAKRGRATNFLEGVESQTANGGSRETHEVVTLTLDWLLQHYPAPTILKMDVECSEDRVLQGATTLLEKIRPTMLCEATEGPWKKILACFTKNHYAIYDARYGITHPRKWDALTQNVIAIPEEKLKCN